MQYEFVQEQMSMCWFQGVRKSWWIDATDIRREDHWAWNSTPQDAADIWMWSRESPDGGVRNNNAVFIYTTNASSGSNEGFHELYDADCVNERYYSPICRRPA